MRPEASFSKHDCVLKQCAYGLVTNPLYPTVLIWGQSVLVQ